MKFLSTGYTLLCWVVKCSCALCGPACANGVLVLGSFASNSVGMVTVSLLLDARTLNTMTLLKVTWITDVLTRVLLCCHS